mmetsp:Transcript_24518/g.85228  ORF Transcript_24518/g.85228 Transcript_24518/m.85228 type:complete len:218 (+) Transcript_24518:729-1382(+)
MSIMCSVAFFVTPPHSMSLGTPPETEHHPQCHPSDMCTGSVPAFALASAMSSRKVTMSASAPDTHLIDEKCSLLIAMPSNCSAAVSAQCSFHATTMSAWSFSEKAASLVASSAYTSTSTDASCASRSVAFRFAAAAVAQLAEPAAEPATISLILESAMRLTRRSAGTSVRTDAHSFERSDCDDHACSKQSASLPQLAGSAPGQSPLLKKASSQTYMK